MEERDGARYEMQVIGYVESCFTEKFGTPRQPGLVESAYGRIRMQPPFDVLDAFDGMDTCSHIWVQFVFHNNRDQRFRAKVRPPRLGGNASLGVFASRSPYRPNPLGLSVVRFDKLERQSGCLYLHYSGGDMVDGTPVLDIKPYLPYADCVPSAYYPPADDCGRTVCVRFSEQAEQACQQLARAGFRALVEEVLHQDPRPRYQVGDTGRRYGMQLDGWEISWTVRAGKTGLTEFFVIQMAQISHNIKP